MMMMLTVMWRHVDARAGWTAATSMQTAQPRRRRPLWVAVWAAMPAAVRRRTGSEQVRAAGGDGGAAWRTRSRCSGSPGVPSGSCWACPTAAWARCAAAARKPRWATECAPAHARSPTDATSALAAMTSSATWSSRDRKWKRAERRRRRSGRGVMRRGCDEHVCCSCLITGRHDCQWRHWVASCCTCRCNIITAVFRVRSTRSCRGSAGLARGRRGGWNKKIENLYKLLFHSATHMIFLFNPYKWEPKSAFQWSRSASRAGKGKVHHTPPRQYRQVLIYLSKALRTTNVCGARRVVSATPDLHDYLPSRKASPPIGWYQIILFLLGNRGTWMLTTCPGVALGNGRRGLEPATFWSQVRHPNHSAIEPGRKKKKLAWCGRNVTQHATQHNLYRLSVVYCCQLFSVFLFQIRVVYDDSTLVFSLPTLNIKRILTAFVKVHLHHLDSTSRNILTTASDNCHAQFSLNYFLIANNNDNGNVKTMFHYKMHSADISSTIRNATITLWRK